MDIYNRQQTLDLKHYDIGIVIGCGGVGSWVAVDLALSGCVDNLYLIDPDIVEDSNLNRTPFTYADIGTYKVDALCSFIQCRRNCHVFKCTEYMTDDLADKMISELFGGDNSFYHDDVFIVDCRDDIYEDVFKLNCKLYKVGYNGTSITIDGNPRMTHVMTQRGGSYSVTPSYVGSSQIVAILVVNDLLYPRIKKSEYKSIESDISKITLSEDFDIHNLKGFYDELGRLNYCITFDCSDILSKFDRSNTIYNPQKLIEERTRENE